MPTVIPIEPTDPAIPLDVTDEDLYRARLVVGALNGMRPEEWVHFVATALRAERSRSREADAAEVNVAAVALAQVETCGHIVAGKRVMCWHPGAPEDERESRTTCLCLHGARAALAALGFRMPKSQREG